MKLSNIGEETNAEMQALEDMSSDRREKTRNHTSKIILPKRFWSYAKSLKVDTICILTPNNDLQTKSRITDQKLKNGINSLS